MIGQGRPERMGSATDVSRFSRAAALARIFVPPVRGALLAVLLSLGLLPTDVALGAEELTLRLRVVWGGGTPVSWAGTIDSQGAQFSQLTPLGMEADVPGSIWSNGNAVHISARSVRPYDGLEFTVTSSDNSSLKIRLHRGGTDAAVETTVDLASLIDQPHRHELDESGNYLLIRRAPGDELRVAIHREHLVLDPEEEFELEVASQLIAASKKEMELLAEIYPNAGSEPVFDTTISLNPTQLQGAPVPVRVPAPADEGVYRLRLTLRPRQGFAARFVPAVGGKPVASREMEFIVFSAETTLAATNKETWEDLLQIDPAERRWWNRLPTWAYVEGLPGVGERISEQGEHQIVEYADQRMLQLAAPDASASMPWVAYPLEGLLPGNVHRISIAVPADRGQQIGVSLLEPNAAGKIVPLGRSMGIHSESAEEATPEAIEMMHWLVWPSSSSPLLLVHNRHPDQSALIGLVEVSTHEGVLPRNESLLPGAEQRIAAALVAQPFLPESLSAKERYDEALGQTVDSWKTFQQVAQRLTSYLPYAGYNAAVICAYSQGSTIYPSRLLDATPRFDTGVLAATSLDPQRKDALELLLRGFDRSALRMFVGMEFSAPLPDLEALRRQSDSRTSGIEWVDPQGATRDFSTLSDLPRPPRYNLLNEQVQRSLLQGVQEVVERYEGHPSFAGIVLLLSGDDFTHLASPSWGMDDSTVARFQRETGIRVPGLGTRRFEVRAQFLLVEKQAEWLAWRSAELKDFLRRAESMVAKNNANRRLVLLPTQLWEKGVLQAGMRPSLLQFGELQDSLMQIGLEAQGSSANATGVLPRVHLSKPPAPLAELGPTLQLQQFHRLAATSGDYGSVLASIRSLDLDRLPAVGDPEQGAGKERIHWLHSTALGAARRRPLAEGLAAADADFWIEGSTLLTTLHDESFSKSLELFRKLPASSRQVGSQTHSPVVVRTFESAGQTIICLINSSPWPVQVKVATKAPSGTSRSPLSASSRMNFAPAPASREWIIELPPYSLDASRFSAEGVRVTNIEAQLPDGVAQSLTTRLQTLFQKVRFLQQASGRAYEVLANPDFEQANDQGAPTGWQIWTESPGGAVVQDRDQRYSGQASLRMTAAAGSVSIGSEGFAKPDTGRISVSLRAKGIPRNQAVLRIVIEDGNGGGTYFRAARLGGAGPSDVPITDDWGWYSLPVTDLPPRLDSPLRLRFTLSGSGTVWIDNVSLSDLTMTRTAQEDETAALTKILYQCQTALDEGDYATCAQLLSGYWPRFLAQHVPEPAAPSKAVAENPASGNRKNESPSVADKIKSFLPGPLR